MNIGTKIRTILVIATCLNTALIATDVAQFNNATLDLWYRIISVALNFIIVACVTYFNNDYTEEASRTTGMMRLLKAQRKGYITGEDFTDLEDDPFFEEDEEYEEEGEEDGRL